MCARFLWSSAYQLTNPASSRWNDYVFVANDPKSLAALNKHVEAPTNEIAMPLIVLGEPGALAFRPVQLMIALDSNKL